MASTTHPKKSTPEANKVLINEVGLRDGLQNLGFFVPTDIKFELACKLIESGVNSLEFTSFVRSDRIAQFVDAPLLKKRLDGYKKMPTASQKRGDFYLSAYVPNPKGYQMARENKISVMGLSTATSESFLLKNINRNLAQNLSEINDMLMSAKKDKVRCRVYVSTVFGCPYEGPKFQAKNLKKIIELCQKHAVTEIVLSDTIGLASPQNVADVLQFCKDAQVRANQLTLHLHDTYGLGLLNISKALEWGIRSFDASIGGLGGCPYALGASGNVCTEDVVYSILRQGGTTSCDLTKLRETANWFKARVPILNLPGKMHQISKPFLP